jgi:polysaccharide biosynthesis protein PelE
MATTTIEPKQTQSLDRFFAGTVLTTLIAALLEWGALYGKLQQHWGWEMVLIAHLGAILLLSLWVTALWRIRHEIRAAILVLILTAVTGPFGTLTGLCLLVFLALFSQDTISFLQWLKALFPEESVERSVALYQRLAAGWDDFSDKRRIMTFQDAIALGTVQQKREALAKISRFYRREFAPALMAALHDANNAIRVQAATVIAKFEQEYMSRFMALSRQHQQRPEDPDTLLKLAQQADAYAYSGILDPQRERDFRETAIRHYQSYLDQQPSDPQTRLALGRLYVHTRQPEQAYRVLEAVFTQDHAQPLNLVMWMIETLYYLRRYDEIDALIAPYVDTLDAVPADGTGYPLIIRDTIRLWQHGIALEKLTIRSIDENR